MSLAVGYCARNKRYRKLSLGSDEAVALLVRALPLPDPLKERRRQ
jgi:hypothetical protein